MPAPSMAPQSIVSSAGALDVEDLEVLGEFYVADEVRKNKEGGADGQDRPDRQAVESVRQVDGVRVATMMSTQTAI